MGAFRDLTGNKFGRLTVIEAVEVTNNSTTKWKCSCECGNEVTVAGHNLKSGNTNSCGCLPREITIERNTSHGMSKTPIYHVWKSMIRRCNAPNSTYYEYYGGRGIKVCPEWSDFTLFYKDMHEGYDDSLSLDRIDVNGGYCKENCRWANDSVQMHNTRKRKNCTSKFKGVNWYPNSNKWIVRISFDNKRLSLGYFIDELAAATAYDNAAERLYGDRPNGTIKEID